ncbi:MAG: WD40 repeat domain-containing protein, partial [Planctomycetes bacterium]|nr:WD40 repeat domain-containing protein [Planctomycetota bacterium]
MRLDGAFGTARCLAVALLGTVLAGYFGTAQENSNAASFEALHTIEGHLDYVKSVAFSPDGQTLVSCGTDKTVRIWEVSTSKELLVSRQHTESVYSAAFSPDGSAVASAGGDATIRIMEASTGKEVRTLTGHKGVVSSVAYSPDGAILASGGDDKIVRLWEVSTGQE